MDNDDYRRGRLTSHKVYGDGMAVLAGDALLTVAFEIVGHAETWPRYDMRALVREVAHAAGSLKLIAGQVADLEGEGKRINEAQLRFIHERKTAALLTTSIRLGAMSANAPEKQLKALTRFGHALGLAFQVIDDILDVTQTSEKLGKSAGKDVAAKKATYPAILGLAGRQGRGAPVHGRGAPGRSRHSEHAAIDCASSRITCWNGTSSPPCVRPASSWKRQNAPARRLRAIEP